MPLVWPVFTFSPMERTFPNRCRCRRHCWPARHSRSRCRQCHRANPDVVEEAGDRQAALGAAVGKHRGRRHEPELAHGVIEALGMGGVIGIGAGNPREHVLEAFARHQVAVGQGRLAESGEQRIAGTVSLRSAGIGLRSSGAGIGGLTTGLTRSCVGTGLRTAAALRSAALGRLGTSTSWPFSSKSPQIIALADCRHQNPQNRGEMAPATKNLRLPRGDRTAAAESLCDPPGARNPLLI